MGRRFDPDRAHDCWNSSKDRVEVALVRVRDSFIISIVPLSFVVVTPWNNLDGINPAKFLIIVSLSAITFSLSLFQILDMLKSRGLDLFQVATAAAMFWTLLSLYMNRYSIDERLFGIYGRSLGAVTFIALFLLAISSAMFGLQALKTFNSVLVTSLVLVAGYFALQLSGFDPAAWEDAYNGIPSSTLGNPNFVSSTLAILSMPLLMLVFYRTRWGALMQIIALLALGTIFFLIRESRSIQGLIILLIGFVGLLLIRISEFHLNGMARIIRTLTFLSIAAIPIVTIFITFGLVHPAGKTLIARSEYWRSAGNLILENPMFGKGFDSFGDWYFFYRDQLAIERSPSFFTDSTHNLILELGVFGGIPLLLTYLVLQALALRGAIRIVTSAENFQAKILVATWIGFNLQSAISPSSLALTTLGFVLTGMVYGAGKTLVNGTSHDGERRPLKAHKSRSARGTRFATASLALMITATGLYLSTVPIVKDAKFRDAIEQGDGRKMIEVSRDWPFNYELSRQAALTLKSSGYNDLAIDMVRDLIDTNPNNIQGWRMLFEYSTLSSDRLRALSRMKELDPLNPELARLTP